MSDRLVSLNTFTWPTVRVTELASGFMLAVIDHHHTHSLRRRRRRVVVVLLVALRIRLLDESSYQSQSHGLHILLPDGLEPNHFQVSSS